MNTSKSTWLGFLGKKESRWYLTGTRLFLIIGSMLGVALIGMIFLPWLFPSFFSTTKVLAAGNNYKYITREHLAMGTTFFLESVVILAFLLHYQMWKLGEK